MVETTKASLDTGDGCFELHYDFSNAENFGIAALVGSFQKAWTKPDENLIPVITSVKQIDRDRVEIRKKYLYKKFYNVPGLMPEEITVINKSNSRKRDEIVMQSKVEYPGLKTEALKLFGFGYMVQRCLVNPNGCSAFKDADKIKMLSDVYMFKQLMFCKKVLYKLEDRSDHHKIGHEELSSLRMSDLFELV